jgi:hypothetical protein
MKDFIAELHLIDRGALDEVESPMYVSLGEYSIVIPSGFLTDYASVPRLLTPLIPKNGAYDRAALIHDYLYWLQDAKSSDIESLNSDVNPTAFMLHKNGGLIYCDKAIADEIFNLALKFLGVGAIRRKAMVYSVKLFAGGAWNENRRLRLKHGFQHKFNLKK